MTYQRSGAAEYTDCTSAECPGYDTKQSDGEVPVMLKVSGNVEHLFIAIAPKYTLA